MVIPFYDFKNLCTSQKKFYYDKKAYLYLLNISETDTFKPYFANLILKNEETKTHLQIKLELELLAS